MLFKKKTLDIINTKKIINFMEAYDDKENIGFAVSVYALNLIDKDINLDNLPEKEKLKLIADTAEIISNSINKYNEVVKRTVEDGKIYIKVNNNVYVSNNINIKIYFNIMEKMKEGIDISEIIDYTIFSVFSGILQPIDIIDVKIEDPLYWEILSEEMAEIIYKTIDDIVKIKGVKNPFKDEDDERLVETDIYSELFRNFNLTPEQVDKCKATDMFKILNDIQKSSIEQDVKKYLKEVQPRMNSFDFDILKTQLINILKGGE